MVMKGSATSERTSYTKFPANLVKNHDSLCMESLKVSNLIGNRSLSRSIGSLGWSTFVEMCSYKCRWYGKNLLQIGSFEPSSKTCSDCGQVNQSMTLDVRGWTCNHCGANHDRDINAAINIKKMAGGHLLKSLGSCRQ